MAEQDKKTANTPAASDAASKKVGKGRRKTREERGLPELTGGQKMTRQLVQNAQNACQYLKGKVDEGNSLPKEVIAACGVLAGALSEVLGE